ncbi:Magnesium and cobalt efflux protein CorC [Minicystis rosea]|nr:Magnesium and cobalt efflux protein CorC [Minicystis rosea]
MLSELTIILALVVLNGIFAAAEIAVISVRSSRLDALVSSGSGSARAVKRLRDNPERFLATVQIGVTVVGAVASVFGGATIAARVREVLAHIPALAPHAESIALGAVVVLVSYLSLVLGELIPKSLALRYAERYALIIARALLALSWLARPVVWFLTASSNIVLRFFGDRTNFTEARLSSEEIQQVVEDSTEAGAVNPNAGQIASRAFDFADLTVGKVMIPRHKVVALPVTATLERVRHIVAEKGYTRLPVYDTTLDNLLGYLNVKDLVARPPDAPFKGLRDLLRPAYFVVETMPAVDLLEDMKRRRKQFAIVVDELGSTSGIVTLEDLVEEIVGDISSEHDAPLPPAFRQDADGSFVVQGDAAVHEVNRRLDIDLPMGPSFSTIAGLALKLAGRIPARGERLLAPDGTELEIADATDRQVRTVRVRRAPAPASEDG